MPDFGAQRHGLAFDVDMDVVFVDTGQLAVMTQFNTGCKFLQPTGTAIPLN